MENLLILVVMFFVGFLIAFQGAVNSALGRMLDHPLHASFVSFGTGFLALILILTVTRIGFPKWSQLTSVPKITLLGGTCGVVFVTCVLLFVPKVGTAKVAVAAICGQIVFSLLLDHFGILGIPVSPVDAKRVIGVGLVIAGVIILNIR